MCAFDSSTDLSRCSAGELGDMLVFMGQRAEAASEDGARQFWVGARSAVAKELLGRANLGAFADLLV